MYILMICSRLGNRRTSSSATIETKILEAIQNIVSEVDGVTDAHVDEW